MQIAVAFFVLFGMFDLVCTFTCDLAARPTIIAPTDPAAPWINSVEFVKPSLEILFGSIPGSSVVLFVLEKLLTNPPDRPSVWDQVKDEVEHLINSRLDQVRLRTLCDNLKEFRRRINLCQQNSGLEKTRCYSTLLDYMIGKEPHFRAVEGRDVALTLGIYTAYTVMTLSVGKVFLILNREHKLRGAARLKKLKPVARGFSTYVNESVSVAVNWRRMEIGKYKKYRWDLIWYKELGSGTIQARRRRSTEFNDGAEKVQINQQQIPSLDEMQHQTRNSSDSSTKRGLTSPESSNVWGKLVVTDGVLGSTIFEQDKSAKFIEHAFDELFKAAKITVARKRDEEGRKLRAIYNEQLLPITNKYWKIYERSDFGTVDDEEEDSEASDEEPDD